MQKLSLPFLCALCALCGEILCLHWPRPRLTMKAVYHLPRVPGCTAMTSPRHRRLSWFVAPLAVLLAVQAVQAQGVADIRKNYTRQDYQIPMRDGVRLYTVVSAPK